MQKTAGRMAARKAAGRAEREAAAGMAAGPGSAGGPGFPGGPPGFAGFGPWPGEPRMMRGPRAKRGDVRAAALALLAEEPMNGYQIIGEISERSDGVWRPSPGSVYPALQQLEDEGLIRAEAGDGGRRAYVLTDEGREYVAAHPDEVRAPWDIVAGSRRWRRDRDARAHRAGGHGRLPGGQRRHRRAGRPGAPGPDGRPQVAVPGARGRRRRGRRAPAPSRPGRRWPARLGSTAGT